MNAIYTVPLTADGPFHDAWWLRHDSGGRASLMVTSNYTYASGKSLKSEIPSDGQLDSIYRAEIAPAEGPNAAPMGFLRRMQPGAERWVSFAVMYDPAATSLLNVDMSIFQVLPEEAPLSDPDYRFRQPNIIISQKGGKYFLTIRYDINRNAQTSSTVITSRGMYLGPASPGVWTQFVVHFILNPLGPGLTEVWRDGVKKVESHLPNGYNQGSNSMEYVGNYIKFGNYSYSWKTDPPSSGTISTLYHDMMLIGDENSSYEEITNYEKNSHPAPLKGFVFM